MKKSNTKKNTNSRVAKATKSKTIRKSTKKTKVNSWLNPKSFALVIVGAFVFAGVAGFIVNNNNEGAAIYFSADKKVVKSGDTFKVKLYADSNKSAVNGVSALFSYPKEILEISNINNSISDYSVDAIVNTEANNGSAVEITRGSYDSLYGKKLVSEIEFIAKKAGDAKLIFDTAETMLASTESNTDISNKNNLSGVVITVE
jgi:hypothetical protein